MAQESVITAAITEESVIKALVTMGCCAWAATIILLPMAAEGTYFQFPGIILLVAVLTKAIRLSSQGKWSASWAVIAFGSLATTLLHFLAGVIWNHLFVWRSDIFWLSLATGIVIYLGGKAALAGAWKRTLILILLTSILTAFVSCFVAEP